MRYLWMVFLVLAILAGVLWTTSAIAVGVAKLILGVFLVLFVLSLVMRGRRTSKL